MSEDNPPVGFMLRHAGWILAGALSALLLVAALLWWATAVPPDPPPPPDRPACTDCGCSARAEPCRAAREGRCHCKRHQPPEGKP